MGGSTDDMSLNDMAELIKNMPKQEEMMKIYKTHIDLLNKVIVSISSNNIKKVVQLEGQIVSGLEGSKKVNNTMLVKAISQVGKDLTEKDYLRMLMIYFACYDLSPKDRETLCKSVPRACHREVLKNMEYLD
mmetsp:Transcript_47818/g.64836  ORF Transcript_47818/g.64836 Transcript_47818/m.64836 type:complete len:132 (+) Transcript_47818:246-641(+)|eukprot:CAMPEP_0176339424 /NCGR_PEP_ID=MMETSP0126-20121128/756_1 /TAXON_ID=141414 ORGANISM="Strombidinopsis acuminatum, Strain SPMC142" /NCGR_SAMPLE_ID=MMETSP0126 /ASSEMBLY_ACC=CAM_ASM_000229 /LENGTH=131 /DNA_ID=CAMNT_0017683011 /DNA_START=935 /DNA_END=1330 /DNA_ORIENTATION=+